MTILYIIPPKKIRQRCWRRLATKYAGVDKLPDYLRSDMKDVNQKQKENQPDQLCLATVNYTKIMDRRKSGRPIQVNGAFYSIKKSRVIRAEYLVIQKRCFKCKTPQLS